METTIVSHSCSACALTSLSIQAPCGVESSSILNIERCIYHLMRCLTKSSVSIRSKGSVQLEIAEGERVPDGPPRECVER